MGWGEPHKPAVENHLPVEEEYTRVEYQKVTASTHLGRLEGLHHAEITRRVDTATKAAILTLEAHVLSIPAGEVTDKILVAVAQRPWWIPAFLWKRIPLSFMQYQLTTEVYEIFPHAREILPLGKSHIYTTSKIQTTEFPYRKGRQ